MFLEFEVIGKPEPRGSKQSFPYMRGWKTTKRGKRIPDLGVRVVDDNPASDDWMKAVGAAAGLALMETGQVLTFEAVYLFAMFSMPRPKAHYRTGRHSHVLRPDAPRFHTIRPDGLKLRRGVEDALTGIVYKDDGQICRGAETKIYGNENPQGWARVLIVSESHPEFDLYRFSRVEKQILPPAAEQRELFFQATASGSAID